MGRTFWVVFLALTLVTGWFIHHSLVRAGLYVETPKEDLTLDRAKSLFEEYLSANFGKHLRIRTWEQISLLDSTFHQPDWNSVSVGYVLDCVDHVDITSLNPVIHAAHSAAEYTNDSVLYIDNYVKVDSGYRIQSLELPKRPITLCTPGQKIYFYGMQEYRWHDGRWQYGMQSAQPFDSFYANFMKATTLGLKK